MKDLHCHLLPGIDDGSKSLDESISLLKEMSNQGVKEIILTPHYIEDSKYSCNNTDKKKLYTELVKRVKKEKIDVTLYLGNEVFFTSNFVDLLKKKEIETLNNNKYLLFEFPMHEHYKSSQESLLKLISRGYVPVLAHPERYKRFLENPDIAEEYLRMGVLLQGNFPSLFGKYGRGPKKLLKYYIKRGWISFLGSDTHHDYSYNLKKLEKKLHRINKDDNYISDLLDGNFDKVINNENISMIK